MISGSFWMIGMRWTIRFLGLISTLILARLLVPEDFGVVAMAMLVIGLLESFSNFGVDLALIRDQKASPDHYNAAWTIKILQGTAVTLLILIFAPNIANYFNEPRFIDVAYILSAGVFLQGFENIGVVIFRKEFNFSKEFRYEVFKKLASFIVTISLAFTLRNYWALVWGIVIGQIASLIISYIMHPYRPKLSFSRFKDIWSFSQWMLLVNIGNYFANKMDEIIVGRVKTTADMGVYNVGADIATLPTTELVMPLSRALFPGFSKMREDISRLSDAYLKVLGTVCIIAFSTSFGLSAVAPESVIILLGEKWINTVPVIEWLAFFGAFIAVSSTAGNLLLVIGKVKTVALLNWVHVALLIPSLYFAATMGSLADVGMMRTFVAVFYCFSLLAIIRLALSLSAMSIINVIWRPLISGFIMYYVVCATNFELISNLFLLLALKILVGITIFIFMSLILWIVSGRPECSETIIINLLGKKLINKNII